MSDFEFSLGSFGAIAKFPMLRFSKGDCSHSFHPISTKKESIRKYLKY